MKPATKSDVPAAVHTNAMLARVVISVWEGRKFDRKVSEEINTQHKTQSDAGRYNKHLFGGRKASPSHSSVLALAGAVRTAHYGQTLPWTDDGWRLLPTTNFFAYTDAIRKARVEFEVAVEKFLADYPKLCADAKVLLNAMYREKDYPTVEAMASKFSVGVEFAKVPSAGDFRVALPAAQIAQIERETVDRVARATEVAMADAWARLQTAVERVQAKLSDPDAIFRDSLIENVKEITEVLARLNVTNDPGLEKMRVKVANEIATLNPDWLRKDTVQRENAVKATNKILSQMADIYGGKL